MFKYSKGVTDFLSIKIKNQLDDEYWVHIDFNSESIDETSIFPIRFSYRGFVKKEKIVNSEINIQEGRNTISTFLHQLGDSQDKPFLQLQFCSYTDPVGIRDCKELGKTSLNPSDTEKELQEMINGANIPTDSASISTLLHPDLDAIKSLCDNEITDEQKEEIFKGYQQLADSAMKPLREEVYVKKHT